MSIPLVVRSRPTSHVRRSHYVFPKVVVRVQASPNLKGAVSMREFAKYNAQYKKTRIWVRSATRPRLGFYKF